MVAERRGIVARAAWEWRGRDGTHDRGHAPHRFEARLAPAQEAVTVAPRKSLPPLDDLLPAAGEFLDPDVLCSGLDRCLRRHGVGSLRAPTPAAPRPAHEPFEACAPGYVHTDVEYLPRTAEEDRRRSLRRHRPRHPAGHSRASTRR
jgi:hypothetical protein